MLWTLAVRRIFQQHDGIHANHRYVIAFVRGSPLWILTMRHLRPAYQSNRKHGAVVLLALTAGLLGGCETNGGPSNPVSELVAFSSGAQASAQPNVQGPARQDAAKPPEKPKSRAQAAMDCWAVAEKSHAGASLEARADFVTKCIDNKLKPSDADQKPEAKPVAAPKRTRADAKPAS